MNQPIRGVCFVAPELERVGGYELTTLALADSLRQQGITVSIVTTTKEPSGLKSIEGLIRIEVRGRLGVLLIFPRLLMVLMRERGNFSIVHCPTFSNLSGLAVLAARVLSRPILLRVATENDVSDFANSGQWKHRLFFRLLYGASGVIAPSEAICQELRGAGFPDKKIFVIPNGVDVDRFRQATPSERALVRQSLRLIANTLVIGTIARLEHRKGIDVLLRAFKTVSRSHDAHLVIIGDGPLADKLRTLARELEIDRSVSWLGFRTDPENWLRGMDVFAFPSRREGSPNAVLEAMATGLPIVATAIGGVVDLIQEGKTGILTPPDDSKTMAAKLIQLASDSSLRANLGDRARLRAAEVFSLDKTVSRVIESYRRVAEQC